MILLIPWQILSCLTIDTRHVLWLKKDDFSVTRDKEWEHDAIELSDHSGINAAFAKITYPQKFVFVFDIEGKKTFCYYRVRISTSNLDIGIGKVLVKLKLHGREKHCPDFQALSFGILLNKGRLLNLIN